ncbi:hypothetical protein YC2023_082315 [Brassica napus]
MVRLGPEDTTRLIPMRPEVLEHSTSRHTVIIFKSERFKGRSNFFIWLLADGTFETNLDSYQTCLNIMSSSRNTSGSQRRGRQSSGEARTTTDGGTTREGQDKNCQVMLELVIAELKADDYRSRMPDVAARKRIEKKILRADR